MALGEPITRRITLFSPDQQEEIKHAYEAGASRSEIARLYHCAPSTVGRWLKLLGVKPRPLGGSKRGRNLKPGQLYQIKHLYVDKRLSSPMIAQLLGMHETSVRSYLQMAGVRLRNPREASLLYYQRERERQRLTG